MGRIAEQMRLESRMPAMRIDAENYKAAMMSFRMMADIARRGGNSFRQKALQKNEQPARGSRLFAG